jgi:hypothetical protein
MQSIDCQSFLLRTWDHHQGNISHRYPLILCGLYELGLRIAVFGHNACWHFKFKSRRVILVFGFSWAYNLERKFLCLQFFQKTNLKILFFALTYWGRSFSFDFLEELKKTKSPFEINWPFILWGKFCSFLSLDGLLEFKKVGCKIWIPNLAWFS